MGPHGGDAVLGAVAADRVGALGAEVARQTLAAGRPGSKAGRQAGRQKGDQAGDRAGKSGSQAISQSDDQSVSQSVRQAGSQVSRRPGGQLTGFQARGLRTSIATTPQQHVGFHRMLLLLLLLSSLLFFVALFIHFYKESKRGFLASTRCL